MSNIKEAPTPISTSAQLASTNVELFVDPSQVPIIAAPLVHYIMPSLHAQT